MSSHLEKLCLEVFSGLGSYSKLANGFRLQSSKGQTCAVYFSDNLTGNSVEIGLSPNALESIIGRSAQDIRDWIQRQNKMSGRERKVLGERGKYPGLAFGTERELKAFLHTWQSFVANDTPLLQEEALGGLEQTRAEKAASDAGFDLTPTREGNWLIFRSSGFPYFLGVLVLPDGRYRIGFSDPKWGGEAAQSVSADALLQAGPWPVRIESLSGYNTLHLLLTRAGQLGPALAGKALELFRNETKSKPVTTEAERVVVQRIGQGLFRADLIEYWQGRCAVTGLDVVSLLRASHIKPWSECESDEERLDVFNGFLLAPHLDALFDGGWITFQDDGEIVVASKLNIGQLEQLGIQHTWRLASISDEHRAYLAYHRQKVFQK